MAKRTVKRPSVKYARILDYVARTPWAILESKKDEILSVLAYRAAGHEFTDEEIEARVGMGAAPSASTQGSIAVVPLWGVVAHRMDTMEESSGGMSSERFAAMMRKLASDPSIGGILIDANSPGGAVTGVPEAAQAVWDARQSKRVVAIANGTMASAAYWICSQAEEIVAIPSVFDGAIGAVGVFTIHKDLSAALENEGVKVTVISAGKRKTSGMPFGPLSDEERAEIQANVDAAYDRFVKDVARGRGVTPSQVRNGYGEGRALSAAEAKATGLIDRIASFDDTLARMLGRRASTGARADASTTAPVVFGLDEHAVAALADGVTSAPVQPVELDADDIGEGSTARAIAEPPAMPTQEPDPVADDEAAILAVLAAD